MAGLSRMAAPKDDVQITKDGLETSWDWIRQLVDKWGPRHSASIRSQADMLVSLRHGNGSWLPRR